MPTPSLISHPAAQKMLAFLIVTRPLSGPSAIIIYGFCKKEEAPESAHFLTPPVVCFCWLGMNRARLLALGVAGILGV